MIVDDNMDRTLRWLLAQARLGPALQLPARRALAGRRPDAVRTSGRAVIRALIRRGDLVRVRIEGDASPVPRDVFALRGHAALLDLTPFLAGDPLGSGPPAPAAAPSAADERVPGAVDLLGALERVQDFQISPALHDGGVAWLDAVLTMLDDFLPGLTVYGELHDPALQPERPGRVFHTDPAARPFWARMRRHGESCRLSRAEDLPPHLRAAMADFGGFSVQVAPLQAPEPAPEGAAPRAEVGLLYLVAREEEAAGLPELSQRLGRFVTHSWRQRLRMGRMVHTDALTGLHNRGYYDSQIGVELERCRRQGTPLTLLLGDLDHFKDINDTYGHPMGDRVLKTVARELLEGLRRIDLVCRVGGEEFALVLPDTGLEAASEVVTRIQVRIANLRLTDPTHPDPLRVTISFGGVVFPAGGESPDELYDLADRMLYLSKQRGRNRCHFWRPDEEPLLALPQYREG